MSKKAQNQKPPFDAISPLLLWRLANQGGDLFGFSKKRRLDISFTYAAAAATATAAAPWPQREGEIFSAAASTLPSPPPYMHWLYPEALARPLVSGGFLNSLFSSLFLSSQRSKKASSSSCLPLLPPCPREGRGRGGRKG